MGLSIFKKNNTYLTIDLLLMKPNNETIRKQCLKDCKILAVHLFSEKGWDNAGLRLLYFILYKKNGIAKIDCFITFSLSVKSRGILATLLCG